MNDLDEFIEAVVRGARVFAGPETAALMEKYKDRLPVEPNAFISEGILWAVDIRKYDLTLPLPS